MLFFVLRCSQSLTIASLAREFQHAWIVPGERALSNQQQQSDSQPQPKFVEQCRQHVRTSLHHVPAVITDSLS